MKYLSCILVLFAACIVLSSPSLAQRYRPDEDIDEPPKEYHESALRRFEIIFTASIPFSALHSYLTVRGVQMIRQSKVAPSISDSNWRSIGGLTVLFSGFIAFWDYMHTRGEKIQDQSTPRDITTGPLTLLMPPGSAYMNRAMPREPVITLLSARF